MKLTEKEMDKISSVLFNLATYCDFMREKANVRGFVIGCYSDERLDMVISNLQDVMRYYKPLMYRLQLLSDTLDDLLVKSRVLDDSENV